MARTKRPRPAPDDDPGAPRARATARLAVELLTSPAGVDFDRFCERYGVSDRSLYRYAKVLREDVFTGPDWPRIGISTVAGTKLIRFSEKPSKTEGTARELLSLYFAMTVLRGLEGTVLRGDLAALWRKLSDGLSPAQRSRIHDLPKKLFAVPYGSKDYGPQDQLVASLLRALLDQHQLRIVHRGVTKSPTTYLFDPYTLAFHRGGLYLLGRSHEKRKIIWLAVERIRSAEPVRGKNRKPVTFSYPRQFSPEKHLDGTFGIVDTGEPPTAVEIVVDNQATETYLQTRQIHPSQKFVRRRGGKTILRMKVRGMVELRNWVLGFGPWLEVQKPAELRGEVAKLLREAAAQYIQLPTFTVRDERRLT